MAATQPAGGQGGRPKPARRNWQVELPSDGDPGLGQRQGFCRVIDDVYERVKQIGEGTYGQVSCAEPRPTQPSG